MFQFIFYLCKISIVRAITVSEKVSKPNYFRAQETISIWITPATTSRHLSLMQETQLGEDYLADRWRELIFAYDTLEKEAVHFVFEFYTPASIFVIFGTQRSSSPLSQSLSDRGLHIWMWFHGCDLRSFWYSPPPTAHGVLQHPAQPDHGISRRRSMCRDWRHSFLRKLLKWRIQTMCTVLCSHSHKLNLTTLRRIATRLSGNEPLIHHRLLLLSLPTMPWVEALWWVSMSMIWLLGIPRESLPFITLMVFWEGGQFRSWVFSSESSEFSCKVTSQVWLQVWSNWSGYQTAEYNVWSSYSDDHVFRKWWARLIAVVNH